MVKNYIDISQSRENLKTLRIGKGYTRKKVSELTGISYSMYNAIERGNRQIGMATALRLADLYGVSLDYIAGRTNIPWQIMDGN